MAKQKHILFLQPYFYNPTLPNFKDRFVMLSEQYSGHIISSNEDPSGYNKLTFDNFVYHSFPRGQNKIIKHIKRILFACKLVKKLHAKHEFDYIHAYDPLFLGLVSVLVKKATRAKLVVEINGHLKTAGFLQKKGLLSWFKKIAYIQTVKYVIKHADMIKFLNADQMAEWKKVVKNKKTVIYHDFVPTHLFDPSQSKDDHYVLLVGHPFHIKGVDILIKAFNQISSEFPKIKLKIVGFCPNIQERKKYVDMTEGNANIEILKPVDYGAVMTLFQRCTFFVLPSRTEAMGRVLIEAMASGKSVIGSRTGGIPRLVKDGENGFLCQKENIAELAQKMKELLQNNGLRQNMENKSVALVKEQFSSERYVGCFNSMIEELGHA